MMLANRMVTKPANKTFCIFDGYVPGTLQATGYQCNITVLSNDILNWRVMIHFPGDGNDEVVCFRFRVRTGEEIQAATDRLAGEIRKYRIQKIMLELEDKLLEEEYSIEKEIPCVLH